MIPRDFYGNIIEHMDRAVQIQSPRNIPCRIFKNIFEWFAIPEYASDKLEGGYTGCSVPIKTEEEFKKFIKTPHYEIHKRNTI